MSFSLALLKIISHVLINHYEYEITVSERHYDWASSGRKNRKFLSLGSPY